MFEKQFSDLDMLAPPVSKQLTNLNYVHFTWKIELHQSEVELNLPDFCGGGGKD